VKVTRLTKLIDQLVDQNLVYRRVDPLDRRRILASQGGRHGPPAGSNSPVHSGS
jgi:hypothetical protein